MGKMVGGWNTLLRLVPKKEKSPDLRVVIMQLEYSKTNMR